MSKSHRTRAYYNLSFFLTTKHCEILNKTFRDGSGCRITVCLVVLYNFLSALLHFLLRVIFRDTTNVKENLAVKVCAYKLSLTFASISAVINSTRAL